MATVFQGRASRNNERPRSLQINGCCSQNCRAVEQCDRCQWLCRAGDGRHGGCGDPRGCNHRRIRRNGQRRNIQRVRKRRLIASRINRHGIQNMISIGKLCTDNRKIPVLSNHSCSESRRAFKNFDGTTGFTLTDNSRRVVLGNAIGT